MEDITQLAVLKYGEKAVPSFRSEDAALLFREGKKAPVYAVTLLEGQPFYAFLNKNKKSAKSPDFWSFDQASGQMVSVWLNGETANVVISLGDMKKTFKLTATDKAYKQKPEAQAPAEAPTAPVSAPVNVNAKAFAAIFGKKD